MLSTKEIDKILSQSLEDGIFSRGEKIAIQEILNSDFHTSEQLSLFRNRSFVVAQEGMLVHEPRLVVKWLEGVNKVIHHRLASFCTTTSEVLFSPSLECRHAIQNQLKAAKRSIDICVFTITDNEITSVIEGRFNAGIVVRIISDNDKAGDRGSDVDYLQSIGVDVKVDHTRFHMHHKFAIFDQSLVLTGSYNWTRSAAHSNQENILISDDKKIVSRYMSEFEKLWAKF
ncbi:MAG: phospholipase D-like domain-containing protein [Myxococcota bacterium]|nr:phospholipase D-like domain-containing protein [Myxococcota bacterium]